MNITVSQCEMCKRRADDRYAAKGWIFTKGTVCISKGREPVNRGAVTGYARDEERDFCSLKCYTAWLAKL